ncbi:MAG: PQQ-binding-like beta-propeller repeat protein [Bacteroidales bacterium]|jgi:outer membrane protein assembly factor BamB|nr:PQQ-binding-like beta-propeller repeat protein [Bacteroidales bacterium]
MMKFTEKEISIFRGISMASGVFTLVIAITMIFSLVQLKTINPLGNKALQSVIEQFDSSPDDAAKADQVRAMDLMARKAYFSSRWQLETGSYLLLGGAIIFIFFQRLVDGSGKPLRSLRSDRPDIDLERTRNHRYILISSGALVVVAIISSFILRTELPSSATESKGSKINAGVSVSTIFYTPGDVNYPFFRGEGSRGIAGGKGFPTEWNGTEGKNIKWKIPVPKPGKNSPVIWGSNLYLTGAEGSNLEIYCIDKNTGSILWTGSGSDFEESSEDVPESDAEAGMAVPTAAVSESGVYAIFGNGNLVGYSHDGKLKWAKNLGTPQTIYGYSASLVIYDNKLIVQYDSQEKLTITGYDTETGELKWETPRDGRIVNSSPVLASFNGEPLVLINGNPNVSAYDPVTGKELWSLPGVSGDVAPSVAVNSKMVFTATDYYNVIALKPGKTGSKVWEDNSYTPDVASPVATDEYLFIATGYGDVACYNSETGDTLWTHYFDDTFYASPIICDGKVWFLGRSGTMHIVEADKELKVISSCPVGENSDCTPAFSEKKIYIRSKNNLYCIGAR